MLMLLGAGVGAYGLIMLTRVESRRLRAVGRVVALIAIAPLALMTTLLIFWWLTRASLD